MAKTDTKHFRVTLNDKIGGSLQVFLPPECFDSIAEMTDFLKALYEHLNSGEGPPDPDKPFTYDGKNYSATYNQNEDHVLINLV